MQTLGLSDSTPRTESRLKSLFWPSVGNAYDVEYLSTQGYWVCAIIALLSFIFLVATKNLFVAVLVLIFYYFGGIGARQRSRYAASILFVAYLADALVSGPNVVKVLVVALLLSNARATWIASRWQAGADEDTLPPRLAETWSDKFANVLPEWLWPKLRYPYYVFSACYLLLCIIGLVRHYTR